MKKYDKNYNHLPNNLGNRVILQILIPTEEDLIITSLPLQGRCPWAEGYKYSVCYVAISDRCPSRDAKFCVSTKDTSIIIGEKS